MAYCKNCGAQIDDQAVICPHCGVAQWTNPAVVDNGGFGWGMLGFCIPVVGLILYLVWKDTKPRTSKAAGKGALISVIIGVVWYLLMAVVGVVSAVAFWSLEQWCYKWLPIFFGCHCRDDRSFHWKGKKFPICARCTGELLGILTAIPGWLFFRPSVFWCVLLMFPLIVDGTIQLQTSYDSTNIRRMLTGIPFGYSLTSLFLISSVAAYRWGFQLVL